MNILLILLSLILISSNSFADTHDDPICITAKNKYQMILALSMQCKDPETQSLISDFEIRYKKHCPSVDINAMKLEAEQAEKQIQDALHNKSSLPKDQSAENKEFCEILRNPQKFLPKRFSAS